MQDNEEQHYIYKITDKSTFPPSKERQSAWNLISPGWFYTYFAVVHRFLEDLVDAFRLLSIAVQCKWSEIR